MALTTYALTTLQMAKAELGLSEQTVDIVLERMINEASEAISGVAGGRLFGYSAEIVEMKTGMDAPRLILDRTPVASIASIVVIDQAGNTASTFETSSYSIEDAVCGFVYRETLWPVTAIFGGGTGGDMLAGSERAAIQVTYAGGWVTPQQELDGVTDPDDETLTRTLPYDLEGACLMTVASMWKRKGHDRNVQTQGVMNGPVTTWRSSEGNTAIGTYNPGILPLEAFNAARRYRRIA